jgi:hypothetical protein
VDQSTIFTWLKTGKLKGEHLARSMRRIDLFDRGRWKTASRMASTCQTIKKRGIMMYSRKSCWSQRIDAAHDVLTKINERVHFARRRFGRYEVIDFLAILFGYAISGESTLEAFYEKP